VLDLADIRIANSAGYYYLASPYSKWEGGLDDAAYTIAKLAGRVMEHGVAVFSPIVHSHTIARLANIDPFSHDFWLPMDKPIAHGAYGMIIAGLPGWRASFGIGEEIKWFKAAKRPIYLLDPSTMTVQVLP
jgi:hypothetical protein